jgi:hypothetical protein
VKDVKIIAASGSGRRLLGDLSMTFGHSSVFLCVQVAKLARPLQTFVDSVLTISTDWATVRELTDSRAGTSHTNTPLRQLSNGVQAIPTIR